MLSGGAGFGKYHHGIIHALYEQDLLPSIVVGSSAGSLLASCLCTLKRGEVSMLSKFDLLYGKKPVEWKKDSLLENMEDALVTGTPLGSVDALKAFVRDFTQDLTFLEVYERNGWTLAITVTDE
jgi:predicted acylesterase/phospholipase RssA